MDDENAKHDHTPHLDVEAEQRRLDDLQTAIEDTRRAVGADLGPGDDRPTLANPAGSDDDEANQDTGPS